jgi:glycosyltransferase involved in cell wall biosynthesis
MNRRRIMIMVRSLGLGGSERQAALVAASLDRSRFEVSLGCVDPTGIRAKQLQEANIEVVAFPITSLVNVGMVREGLALMRHIRQRKIELVHVFDAPMASFGAPFARLAGVSRLLTSVRTHRELTPGIGRRALLRFADRIADAVVTNCDSVRRQLIADEKLPAGKILLCGNGIDLDKFNAGARERPPEFAGAELVIGVACALRAEKGLPSLIAAFSRLKANERDMRLAIVGSGAMREALENEARAAGCAERTIFVPETQELTPLLRGIDIFVLPSLSEALSNSLMEAMACGCCAVASNVGGNPELVRHNETGLLFEAGDVDQLSACLTQLIDDRDLLLRLAGNGRRFIEDGFSMPAMIARMTSIYEEQLADRSR